MIQIDVAIVVVAFKSGDQLRRCLDSVNANALRAGLSIYTVVVDNHEESSDQWAESECDQYIPLPNNPGFGVANNAALKHIFAQVEFTRVLLLNPDAWLQDSFMLELRDILNSNNAPDVIAPLMVLPTAVKALPISTLLMPEKKSHRVVLHTGSSSISINSYKGNQTFVGAASFTEVTQNQWLSWPLDETPSLIRLIDAETGDILASHTAVSLESLCSIRHIILNAGSYLSVPAGAGDIAHRFLDTGFYSKSAVDVAAWCGGAVALSRRYLDDVGRFSAAFFLYYEDSDFSLRGLRAGYLTKFNPDLVVYHEYSSSTEARPTHRNLLIIRSRGVFASRGSGRIVALTFLLSQLNRKSLTGLLKNPRRLSIGGGARNVLKEVEAITARSNLSRNAVTDE